MWTYFHWTAVRHEFLPNIDKFLIIFCGNQLIKYFTILFLGILFTTRHLRPKIRLNFKCFAYEYTFLQCRDTNENFNSNKINTSRMEPEHYMQSMRIYTKFVFSAHSIFSFCDCGYIVNVVDIFESIHIDG